MPPIKFVIFSSAFFKLGNRCVVVYLKTNYTLKPKKKKKLVNLPLARTHHPLCSHYPIQYNYYNYTYITSLIPNSQSYNLPKTLSVLSRLKSTKQHHSS